MWAWSSPALLTCTLDAVAPFASSSMTTSSPRFSRARGVVFPGRTAPCDEIPPLPYMLRTLHEQHDSIYLVSGVVWSKDHRNFFQLPLVSTPS